jgi:anti-sigma factor (TIGR02949 family)
MDRLDRYTCEEALRRLEDFLDRELTPEEMHRVQAHLDTCGACTGQFQFEREILNGLRDKIRPISLPPELRARIARSLDAERRAAEG